MTAPAASTTEFAKGLAGVVAGQTSICSLEGTLRYRGYDIEPLARAGDFEEVAYLLLHGELPSAAALDATHGPEAGDPYFAPPVTRSFLEESRTPPGRAVDRVAIPGTVDRNVGRAPNPGDLSATGADGACRTYRRP